MVEKVWNKVNDWLWVWLNIRFICWIYWVRVNWFCVISVEIDGFNWSICVVCCVSRLC